MYDWLSLFNSQTWVQTQILQTQQTWIQTNKYDWIYTIYLPQRQICITEENKWDRI